MLVYLRQDVSKEIMKEPSNSESGLDDEVDEKDDDCEKSGEVEAQNGSGSVPESVEMKDQHEETGKD